jgi:ABC-2 type transport system permease protein
MRAAAYWHAFRGILTREFLRFLRQRGRFFSALVRPLVWLFVFAVGFRSVLGLSRIPPYDTYILYEDYIVPGLIGIILLFSGMLSALSMVFDREVGTMKVLLTSPLPRRFLLLAQLLATVLVALPQVYVFLAISWLWGIRPPLLGYLYVLPALVLAGLMLAALGMLLASTVEQLENFAGVMNFVIFPVFFASTALYPLWRLEETSGVLHAIALSNPFSHAVELIRFALYGQFNPVAFAVVALCLAGFVLLAFVVYDPGRALGLRKGGAA